MILQNTIKRASQLLKNNNIISHQLDAEIILSNILRVKREFLIVNNLINVSKKQIRKYNLAINRRINREPIAYITVKKEFWALLVLFILMRLEFISLRLASIPSLVKIPDDVTVKITVFESVKLPLLYIMSNEI